MQKICTQNIIPDHFLILRNSLEQVMRARNSFQNKVFWNKPVQNVIIISVLSNYVKENQKSHVENQKSFSYEKKDFQ